MALDVDPHAPALGRSADPDGPRPPRRQYPWALATLVVVALVVAAGWATTSRGATVQTGPTGSGPAPSPLFDQVEQLTPTSLPDGWARCGGVPSGRPDASSDWWAQTFGPVVDGECAALITVTQIPPDSGLDVDPNLLYEEVKIGEGDAMRWDDERSGAVTLFTWVIDQNLVIESCCTAGAEAHLLDVALWAEEGARQRQPASCTDDASDLERESLVENAFGKRARLHDEDGCPIRTDIAELSDERADAHCFAGVSFLTIGTPFGASTDDSEGRLYTREPGGTHGAVDPRLDLDATLPPTAASTRYSKDGRTLWIDAADGEVVYLVYDDGRVEAWPRDREGHGCA